MSLPNFREIVAGLEKEELLEAIGELSGALAILKERRRGPVAIIPDVPDDWLTAQEIAIDLKFLKADGTPKVKPVYRLAERPNDPLPCFKPSPRKFRVSRPEFVAWKHRQHGVRGAVRG